MFTQRSSQLAELVEPEASRRVMHGMVATRFAVAIHIMLLLATEPEGQATSGRLAESVGTNPVVIRRLAGQLARAGLIRIRRGPGGAELARPADRITLAEIWRAMRRNDLPLLPIHQGQARQGMGREGTGRGGDAVARAVPGLLRGTFDEAEAALEASLAATTLAALRDRLAGG